MRKVKHDFQMFDHSLNGGFANVESSIAELVDVRKSFVGKTVINGINLTIPKDSRVLITGSSGSGKSTCLRMFAGLETPDSGEVYIEGQHISKVDKQLFKIVGYGQQDPSLDSGLTVLENILFTSFYTSAKKRTEIIEEAHFLCSSFGLLKILNRMSDRTLSGGEQAKVAIIRAILRDPKMLLLDEPTSSVDPEGTEAIYKNLTEIYKQKRGSLVVVTHDVDQARPYFDINIHIESGKVVDKTKQK